jgi:hypothetical protein
LLSSTLHEAKRSTPTATIISTTWKTMALRSAATLLRRTALAAAPQVRIFEYFEREERERIRGREWWRRGKIRRSSCCVD